MADGQEVEVMAPGEHAASTESTAIEPVAPVTAYPAIPPKVVGGLPYVRDYVKLAHTISGTELVPAAFRGRWDAITAAFMRGHEMGLGPMQALDSFHVIQGKTGLSAEAMRALILSNGHSIILSEVYDDAGRIQAVVANCRRKDWPAGEWHEYRYSLDDARLDQLVEWHEKWESSRNGKSYRLTWNPFGGDPQPDWVNDGTRKVGDNWKKKPRAMLDARATSGAGRRWFADVLAGMSYTPEEIQDFTTDDDEPEPAPPHAAAAPAQQPEGVSDFQHGGADAPSGDADVAPPPAAEKTADELDAERNAAVERAKAKQPATKKAASRAPAAKKTAAPPAAPAPDAEPPQERSEHLPSGELRVTQAMATQIHTAFHKMDPSFTRDAKLRYARNVLEDETIGSTWDMSVGQASELLDGLRIINGDAPPHDDEAA